MKSVKWMMIVILLLTSPAFCHAAADPVSKAPAAAAVNPVYQFEPVLEGDEVMHDFIIQNKGTAELKIERVKTTCGCTTASYTRQIPSGGEGKISIKVNTSGYGDREIKKGIIVQTNDPANQKIRLTVTGHVNDFATIRPKRVRMAGEAGKPVTSKVTIIPKQQYPFKVLQAAPINGKNVRVELEEVKEDSGSKYLLTVVNLKEEQSRYFDTILVKTDSKVRPEFKISVYGNIVDKQ